MVVVVMVVVMVVMVMVRGDSENVSGWYGGYGNR